MQENKKYTLHLGSMLDVLDTMPDNSIDAVVTDPPYEINFMGKGWDNSGVVFQKDTWAKVLRVLKPGGHLLAFNHSRTFHRMAVAIEDAGFQIRDTIMWMYGSGFPKSHDISKAIDRAAGIEHEKWPTIPMQNNTEVGSISKNLRCAICGKALSSGNPCLCDRSVAPSTDEAKQWQGWGTALKPSYEPIIMARKPLEGTIADNVLKHGVGGINIDECRVETNGEKIDIHHTKGASMFNEGDYENVDRFDSTQGRFPANTIHDGSEEVTDLFPNSNGNNPNELGDYGFIFNEGERSNKQISRGYDDSGSAARFFYTAKANKKDRDEGLDTFNFTTVDDGRQKSIDNAFQRGETLRKNIHPTVKPTELMQYLVRLVTPKGGTILDPFMGSGSTGKAAMIENNERDAGYHFIGIDLEPEYIEIAEARIEYGINYKEHKAKEEEIEKKLISDNQISFEL